MFKTSMASVFACMLDAFAVFMLVNSVFVAKSCSMVDVPVS